jgi:hypothetical protein
VITEYTGKNTYRKLLSVEYITHDTVMPEGETVRAEYIDIMTV